MLISLQMYRVTIRATQEGVPQALSRQMEQKLGQGVKNDALGPYH